MKVDNILLPFDGSEYSLHATRYALDMAKMTGAHVHIIYCDDWNLRGSEVPESIVEMMKESRRSDMKELLKKAGEIFEGQGPEYTLEAVPGSPGEVLTERAKSGDYDLIIMGSHGHSDIAGLFLGSVTHKVLNKIYCPVLIVP